MNGEIPRSLGDLRGKALDEAAQTYAFGVLQVDVADDLQSLWEKSFDDGGQQREAETALSRLGDRDRELLLFVAMQATAEDRPETKGLFTDSVEQAGQSLFVVEIATLSIAAALLLREWNAKGRAKKVHRKTVVEPDRITIEEDVTDFAPSQSLAKALAKLGLGSGS